MKTRKRSTTPSTLATRMFKRRIRFDDRTDRILSEPVAHQNKKDDLCNNNQCVNPEFKRLGFGQLPRRMMPQFEHVNDAKTLISKINHRFNLHVKGHYKYVDITQLHPTQNEISRSRVKDILSKWETKKSILSQVSNPPIITSNTGSVIDGHHRSEALKMAVKQGILKTSDKVRVFVIEMPAWTILSMANLFGYNKNSQSF
jgi:hypothetical protein